ncbi:flagellar biosynthetic protein FliO [Larsenimonas suaedae]|uniref:Flagellar protein n=1 Tax=Larsenimonas suaedae TaxID=1851019 RepID=A0ABU1GTK7_9GAMM|nr:flagellar biosynthetic protein FliO [Larsenimonas suaedae]MCM2971613.1 flagellar biosynthetic protein FliO [Larsenimonas suaedae]MDR5895165.1 flagellar biosynthetic protein FliO [Larsenimonas suaedae]
MTALSESSVQTAITLGSHVTAQAAPVFQSGSGLGGMESLGKMVLGLLVVVALIFACAALVKRMGPMRQFSGANQQLRVLGSQAVGQRERVVVIQTEDARLVLGVTSQSITHLHTLPPLPEDEVATKDHETKTLPTFREALAHNLKKKMARTSSQRDNS